MLNDPAFAKAMSRLLRENKSKLPPHLVDLFSLDEQYGWWANVSIALVRTKRQAMAEPDRIATLDRIRQRAEAARTEVAKITMALHAEATASGEMKEHPDPGTPIGTRYDFEKILVTQRWTTLLGVWLAMDYALADIHTALGLPTKELLDEIYFASRQVWMCLSYMRSVGPVAYAIFSCTMRSSLEAGNAAERSYVLDTMLELDRYTQTLPKDMAVLEETVLRHSAGATGRSGYASQ